MGTGYSNDIENVGIVDDLDRTYSLQFPQINQKTLSNYITQLSSAYENIDLSAINDILKIMCIGNEIDQTQLFSFIMDMFTLISHSLDNYRYSINQFIESYKIADHFDLQNLNITKQDFINACNQYIKLFGSPIELTNSPNIKIMDNFAVFISYTLSMSNAIKQYVDPKPPKNKVIIDFWIIPNKTVNKDNENVALDNNIGDIELRLKNNKIVYIKKQCKSCNITLNTTKILQCLSSLEIRNELNQRDLNRVIFIIDRRYSKNNNKDYLYCYIPPNEYGKIIGRDDLLNISHSYCSSNFILPKSTKQHNIIGGTSHLNGYMFMLSFLIYEKDEDDEEKKKDTNDGNQTPQKLNLPQMIVGGIISAVTNTAKISSLSQISTAFVKCYFYTQGYRGRFLPGQIINVWKRYFMCKGKEDIDMKDCKQVISKLFGLYLYDPYFHLELDLQNILKKEAPIDYFIKEAGSDEIEKLRNKWSEKSKKWKKLYCQHEENKKRIKNKNEQLILLQKVIGDDFQYKYQWNLDNNNDKSMQLIPEYQQKIIVQSRQNSIPELS